VRCSADGAQGLHGLLELCSHGERPFVDDENCCGHGSWIVAPSARRRARFRSDGGLGGLGELVAVALPAQPARQKSPRSIVAQHAATSAGRVSRKARFPHLWGRTVFPHFLSANIRTYRARYHVQDRTVIRGEFSYQVDITTFPDIEKKR